MRSTYIIVILLFCQQLCQAQSPALKTGDWFPDVIIRHLVNAPVQQFDVNKENRKLLILNFWGTWCTPCIPEMDSLAVLQQKNKTQLQVIAISNEPVDRLKKYLQQKPSALWLASDTGNYLYRQFGFNYVGQSAIIDCHNRIVALVRTDSINQSLIDKVLKGEPIISTAETGNKPDAAIPDAFSIDSSSGFQVMLCSYKAGMPSMSKRYPRTIFEGRRRSYINVCPVVMYRDAFDIQSPKQVIYETDEKSICDFSNKNTLWCFDLLVKPEAKDSFDLILQQTLNRLLPVKARPGKRSIPVYVLRQKTDAGYTWTPSAARESTYGFSGRGFDGTAIPLKDFADYLGNELGLPVVDETGLTGKYDIKTENVLRSKENILDAIEKLGLEVEKANREMEVLIISGAEN